MKKSAIDYSVYARFCGIVSVTITAESLEAARQKAEAMKMEQFVDIGGEYLDGRFSIIGVQESDWNLS